MGQSEELGPVDAVVLRDEGEAAAQVPHAEGPCDEDVPLRLEDRSAVADRVGVPARHPHRRAEPADRDAPAQVLGVALLLRAQVAHRNRADARPNRGVAAGLRETHRPRGVGERERVASAGLVGVVGLVRARASCGCRLPAVPGQAHAAVVGPRTGVGPAHETLPYPAPPYPLASAVGGPRESLARIETGDRARRPRVERVAPVGARLRGLDDRGVRREPILRGVAAHVLVGHGVHPPRLEPHPSHVEVEHHGPGTRQRNRLEVAVDRADSLRGEHPGKVRAPLLVDPDEPCADGAAAAVGVARAPADPVRAVEPEAGLEPPHASATIDHEANRVDVAATPKNLILDARHADRDLTMALSGARRAVLSGRRGGRHVQAQGKGHGGQGYRRAALDACVVASYWVDGGFPPAAGSGGCSGAHYARRRPCMRSSHGAILLAKQRRQDYCVAREAPFPSP